MPSLRSFISNTSVRRIGFGISSRGSLAGFSNSFKISTSVISPIPSSSAIFFLSFTRFCKLPEALFSVGVSSVSPLGRSIEPKASAKAAPKAVCVLRTTNCCFFFFGAVFFLANGDCCLAASVWIFLSSSVSMPSLSNNALAAS